MKRHPQLATRPVHTKQEPAMFESIVSKIASVVRNTIRAVGAATRKSPWFLPVAIVCLFFVW